MPLKIVYLTDYIYPQSGLERMLVNKANAFAENGLEVSIITCVSENKPVFFSLDSRVRIYDTGVEYDTLKGMSGPAKALAYKRLNLKHKKQVEKYLKEIRADVAISMHKAERRFLTSIKDGSKKILEIHYDKGAATRGHNKFRWSSLLRADILVRSMVLGKSFAETAELDMIAKYDKFVVLTEEDREQWGRLKNIEVIPNFLTVKTYRSDCTAQRAIAVGRLSAVKRYDMLIDIWDRVDRGAWKLDIYGDGDLREKLQVKIDKKGLGGSVTLHHATNDIMKRYEESSLYILTSRSEGFPMVLLEAMASGIPAVSFACKCGPGDMITNGKSGFIIDDINDADAMAEKIELLLKNDTLRKEMGAEAEKEMGRYGKEAVVKKWIELFKVLSEK